MINQYTELLFGSEKTVQKPAATPRQEAAVVVAPPADLPDHPFFHQTGARKCSTSATRTTPTSIGGKRRGAYLDYLLMAEDGTAYPGTVGMDSTVTLYLKVLAHRDIALPIFGLNIKTKEGLLLYGSNSLRRRLCSRGGRCWPGRSRSFSSDGRCDTTEGDYLLSVGLASGASLEDAMPRGLEIRFYPASGAAYLAIRRAGGHGTEDRAIQRGGLESRPQAGCRIPGICTSSLWTA